MTRNQLQYMANEEIARSNRAKELETNRHNMATEYETARSNQANEKETKRANVTREGQQQQTIDEAHRHNVTSEVIEGVKAAGTVLRGVGSII